MNKQCECCLSSTDLVELTDNYADLIISCFSIEVLTCRLLDKSSNFVCCLCIEKIEESSAFRTQILISQTKLKESYFLSTKTDDFKYEVVIKSEPSIKEETFSDCETDDFKHGILLKSEPPLKEEYFPDCKIDNHDNSTERNMTPKENSIVKINLNKNESNDQPIIEKVYDSLHDSYNPSLKQIKMPSKGNLSTQTNQKVKSNLKRSSISIRKLKQTSALQSTSGLDSKHKNCNDSYPFNMDKTALTCDVCSEIFTTHTLLIKHLGAHFDIYICYTCEKIFSKKKNLTQHMKIHEDMQSCTVCHKLIKPSNMAVHLKHHKEDFPFKCTQCPEKFSTYIIRLKHMNTDHNVDIYKYHCKVCPKKFYVQRRLNEHVENCHLEKTRVTCDFCGLKLFKNDLNRHMREHSDEKKYDCHICDKKYKRKSHLTEHLAIHNGEKFKCTHCDSQFAYKNYLLKHIKVKHS